MDKLVEAFRMGFEYGRTTGTVPTYNELDLLYPEIEYHTGAQACFINGAEDGSIGDTWRLERIREAESRNAGQRALFNEVKR